MVSYEYSRCDGRQEFFEIDPEELMAELTKELLHHSDTSSALRALMQRGIESRLEGMDDLLRKLRSRRQQILEKCNLHSNLGHILRKLSELAHSERQEAERHSSKKADAEEDDDLLWALQRLASRSLQNGRAGQQFDQLLQILEQGLAEDTIQSYHPRPSLPEAMLALEELLRLEQLERRLERVLPGADLNIVIDSRDIEELLGQEARNSWERTKQLTSVLEEAGYITRAGDFLDLTARGVRKIGEQALRNIFAQLKKNGLGKHEANYRGIADNWAEESKRYEFGDHFYLHLERTLMNSLLRESAGIPLKLEPEDFEVYRVQHLSRCATVLMLDQSCSMPLRGNFLAAKKVALALDSLIRSHYPGDKLYIVGFSDYATELKREALYQLIWNGRVYGTNMHHAFMLSRKLLSRDKCRAKQIIMITDGEPTAHLENGRVCFTYPPNMTTTEETLREVMNCTREGITINAFMLDDSPYPVDFINRLTKINKGRVFFTGPQELGQYVLVDYIAGKRKQIVS